MTTLEVNETIIGIPTFFATMNVNVIHASIVSQNFRPGLFVYVKKCFANFYSARVSPNETVF